MVELDLVTYDRDRITIAECKKNGRDLEGKPGRTEVRKKCQAAVWLRADELLFATTADSWTTSSQSTIKAAVESFSGWGPLGPPTITPVSKLGAARAQSSTLPVDVRRRPSVPSTHASTR